MKMIHVAMVSFSLDNKPLFALQLQCQNLQSIINILYPSIKAIGRRFNCSQSHVYYWAVFHIAGYHFQHVL